MQNKDAKGMPRGGLITKDVKQYPNQEKYNLIEI